MFLSYRAVPLLTAFPGICVAQYIPDTNWKALNPVFQYRKRQ